MHRKKPWMNREDGEEKQAQELLCPELAAPLRSRPCGDMRQVVPDPMGARCFGNTGGWFRWAKGPVSVCTVWKYFPGPEEERRAVMIQLACGGQPRLRESPRQLPGSSRVAQLLPLCTLPKRGAISEAAPSPPPRVWWLSPPSCVIPLLFLSGPGGRIETLGHV